MDLDYTSAQQALRGELRAYLQTTMTPDVRSALADQSGCAELSRSLTRRFGRDGWLGIGWPAEYGGRGGTAIEQYIVFDEMDRAGAPFPFVSVNTVAPTLLRFADDRQKDTYLPGILAGEVIFAIGYTEPDAGTDLASLRTSAVLDGTEWVVNGSKVFTTGANDADVIWLACRTDPDLPRHAGISIILVPTSAPGFAWTPIRTVGDLMTTTTYYSDVRVPADHLVGEPGLGWRMITTQLNHERVGLAARAGRVWRLWSEVRDWALAVEAPEGARVMDRAWVRADLARCFVRLEAMDLLNRRVLADLATDRLQPADASAVKVYATETQVEVYRLLLGILEAGGWLRAGSPGAALRGEVERAARTEQINTFGGGANDVQREIIAATGLRMIRGER